MCDIKVLIYDGENDGTLMDSINRHFNNDKRVRFGIYGVNCNEDFDGFYAYVPCLQDGKLVVKHKICIGDFVRFCYTAEHFPYLEVIHV